MTRFGIITAFVREDPSSARLVEACNRHGEATVIDPASLAVAVDEAGVEVRVGGEPADAFDVFLLVRGLGREGDPDFQFEVYRVLEEGEAPVINRLGALLAAQDKFRTSYLLSRAGIPTPEVRVVQRPEDVDAALGRLGCAVAKPIWGSLGDGIELLRDDEEGRRRAVERLGERPALYLQRYVEHGGRDIRAFVVGGRVAAAMERIAPPGEFRTNVSIGALARPIDLPSDVEETAVRAVRAIGLEWAGVDLVDGPEGPTVIEVNGSPNWEGIYRATGRDMADAIARHAAHRARSGLRLAAPVEGMGG